MYRQNSPRSRGWLVAWDAVLALVVGLWFGGHPSWLPSPLRSTFVSETSEQQLTNEVYGLIQKDYYRPISRSQLVNQGLAGAVASLDDPYSHYFDPTDYSSFENESNPHLSGIGIDVVTVAKGLEVVEAFPGSPAARAGLVHGDVITHVGATSLAGRSSSFSAALIKGPSGSKVSLTVLVGRRSHTVTLVRADLTVPVADGHVLDYQGHKLGVVQLTAFTEGSGAETKAQVEKVLKQGAQGLILDLRENGGGLLEEGVRVASIFIPDGTIVSTAGRAVPRQVYMATGGAISTSIPLVVLVDHNTASAAEIVTGALQDRGRAKVVGTHTYGKGVFQEIQPLPNGGALDFTVGEYFTPSGRNLGGGGVKRGAGITPNVYAVTNLRDKTDTALLVAERTVAAELR